MDLNSLDTHGLVLALAGARHLPLDIDLRERVVRCRVRTCEWVPDGLALAGHPDIAEELSSIGDYPCFDLVFPLPGCEPRFGHDALGQFGSWLTVLSAEIRQRVEEVEAQVRPLREDFDSRQPTPWHITNFDPTRQVISLGDLRLTVVPTLPSGSREDLRRLFLPALLGELRPSAPGPSRRARPYAEAYIEAAIRGDHVVRIRVNARQHLTINLLTRERVPARRARPAA